MKHPETPLRDGRQPALDELDRKILNAIQRKIPLVERPFLELAGELGTTEEEMLARLRCLWDEGILRRIGPIVNYPAWGMSGVLVAANLDPARTAEAREIVNDYPEITHAYLRDHPWNFWFTVIAEDEEARDLIIDRVAERAGLKDVQKLKRQKSFKLKVDFKL